MQTKQLMTVIEKTKVLYIETIDDCYPDCSLVTGVDENFSNIYFVFYDNYTKTLVMVPHNRIKEVRFETYENE